MKTPELLQRAQAILKANGHADKVFFTSDGCPFLKEHHAKPYAKTLKDSAITEVSREEANGAPAADAGTGETETKVKALDKMNTAELAIEVAKRPGLVVPEKTVKKDVVKLIEEYDAQQAEAGAEGDVNPNTEAAASQEPAAGEETK